MSRLKYYNFLGDSIVGVDEVGRGALAGPVVVAACQLPCDTDFSWLQDSKKLSEKRRESCGERLRSDPRVFFEIVFVSHEEVDRQNVLQASLYGMMTAVERLGLRIHAKNGNPIDYVVCDGPFYPFKEYLFKGEALVAADQYIPAVQAAAILAKVARDRWMRQLNGYLPDYRFDKNKGYGTADHRVALHAKGISSVHRKTFAPVQKAMTIIA